MILLDTHVVIWLMTDPGRLSRSAHEAILQARIAGERIAYSPVSMYEIAYAVRRKRLPLNSSAAAFIEAIQGKLTMVPLTAEIAVLAAELPDPFHGDPFDRVIAATAIVGDCVLITHDDRIRKSKACKVLW
jgi:PIN domain nuclease of toxin-antitoxin system